MSDIQEDISQFIHSASNKNTNMKTKSDIKTIEKFLETQNEYRHIEAIPPAELDILLSRFFISAKKCDGSDYEPNSLRGFLSSVNRFLSEKIPAINVMTSPEFRTCQQTVKAKQILLKKQGQGNKPNAAQPLTEKEEETLWAKNLMGLSSPEALLNA